MISAFSSASHGSSAVPSASRSVSACSPSRSTSFPACSSAANEPVLDPVAQLVAELVGFERSLRSLFAAGGRLSTVAAEAQAAEGLSLVAGHQVFASISGAQGSVADAIGRIATAHRQLEVLGRQLGRDVTGYGELKPPAPGFFTSADAARHDVLA